MGRGCTGEKVRKQHLEGKSTYHYDDAVEV